MMPQKCLGTVALPWRMARKIVIAVLGMTVLAFGVALIVLPGPAVVVIPLGLAILGTEFLWARRLLQHFRTGANRAWQWTRKAQKEEVG